MTNNCPRRTAAGLWNNKPTMPPPVEVIMISDDVNAVEILDSSKECPTEEQQQSLVQSGRSRSSSSAFCDNVTAICLWTLLFGILWLLLLLYPGTILDSAIAIISEGVAFGCAMTLFVAVAIPNSRRYWSSCLYAILISSLLFTQTSLYATMFQYCPQIENVLEQLRTGTPESIANLPYDEQYRPLQAKSLGNTCIIQLNLALYDHFDRYARNEITEPFHYVKRMNLVGNYFDDTAAMLLIWTLQSRFAYTESLSLGRNPNLGDSTAEELADFITNYKHTNLTWIDLEGTSLTSRGITQLYRAIGTLSPSSRTFEYLGLSSIVGGWSSWRRTDDSVVRSLVGEIHQVGANLEWLSLDRNRIGDQHLQELSHGILRTNITKLSLISSQISAEGIPSLIPLVQQPEGLQELQLGDNPNIGDDGTVLLANALTEAPNTTRLTNLALWKCGVKQRGAEAFLSIFPSNNRLEFVVLATTREEKNKFDTDTLTALEDALAANRNKKPRGLATN